MRQARAKISYLDSKTLTNVKQDLVSADVATFNWRWRLRQFFLRRLLGIQDGIIYIFSTNDKLLERRLTLEELKAEGLLDSYGEGPVYADYPRLNFFGISFSPEKDKPYMRAWGYCLPYEDKAVALDKSLWEMCERYTTCYSSTLKSVEYPTFSVGDASFLYDFIPHFSPKQITSDSTLVSSKTDMEKMAGFMAPSLTGYRRRFLPADCFFWGERVNQTDKYFQDTTTSGSSGGATKTQAVLSSIYELIERDVFLLFWLTGVKPPLVEIGNETGEFFDQIREARQRYNLEVYFFNLTYDVAVPACVCLIIDPVLNLVALGGKVHPVGDDALKGAYQEALATLSVLRSRGKRVQESLLKKLLTSTTWGGEAIDKTVRVNLYHCQLGIDTLKQLWLTGNTKRTTVADFSSISPAFTDEIAEHEYVLSELKALVKKKGEGYHAYVHHFSSVLTKRFGSHVARVFIPAFLKLYLTEKRVTPISQRLVEFANEHQKMIDSDKDLNHLPHPFP